MPIASIEEAIAEFRAGRMVIIVDDEDRENEGDLSIAAELVTPEAINFMARHGRGLICLAMTGERLDELDIPLMVRDNTSAFNTAFCVSIEAKRGVTTGISAYDRAVTIKTAVDPASTPKDLARPGHIFPLRARQGGVLRRAGQTEAVVDLARIAGLNPAGVICEVMKDDGTMARLPDLETFAKEHDLKIITVADLIKYRMSTESLVHRQVCTKLPTRFGEFRLFAYRNDIDQTLHLALVKGDIDNGEPCLVRVHSACLTGDIFGSLRCDCGFQFEQAMEVISKEGRGVLLYLRHGGGGSDLVNKLKAYELGDRGEEVVETGHGEGWKDEEHDYGIGAQILSDLGVRKMRLLTNNPRKFVALGGYGLEIVERVPIEVTPCEHNEDYLAAKKTKLGHFLSKV